MTESPTSIQCESCRHVILSNEVGTGVVVAAAATAVTLEDSHPPSNSSLLIIPALDVLHYPEQHQQLRDNDPSCLEQVFIVKCTSCDKSVALRLEEKYCLVEELLRDTTKPDGWWKVESHSDRLVLFILSQIIHREHEVSGEEDDEAGVEYAFPPPTDIAKVLWIKGSAVGFYSVKPKGSLDLETMDWYNMTVIDTLFIRSSHRRKGHASSAINDVLADFPDQDIGFSFPISPSMVQVLKKHLTLHPADRMKLWEITGCGAEGNCQILWFMFMKNNNNVVKNVRE